jgi:hypothetical protein
MLLIAMTTAAPVAAQRDLVGRARALYNQQQYDAAIAAATEARRFPALADVAALVLARARLERFRQSADQIDLSEARAALRGIQPAKLTSRDRIEMVIGLAEALFLDDQFGAAAEMFESTFDRADEVGPAARERVLDWWASALDRQAQNLTGDDRDTTYQRMLERMENELRWNPSSAVAPYWVVAAARGEGDLDRAWEAAIAAWVRAPLAAEHAATLRADVERLVLDGIIPERVRQSPTGRRDAQRATAAMRAEWEAIKQKWGNEELKIDDRVIDDL